MLALALARLRIQGLAPVTLLLLRLTGTWHALPDPRGWATTKTGERGTLLASAAPRVRQWKQPGQSLIARAGRATQWRNSAAGRSMLTGQQSPTRLASFSLFRLTSVGSCVLRAENIEIFPRAFFGKRKFVRKSAGKQLWC